ncbi:MAG TPA: hypothetical protein ENK18_04105 [Deltaproteobacteria bacterium]|nr:hypothetical protein [Deltaproteobacteria bacterium]
MLWILTYPLLAGTPVVFDGGSGAEVVSAVAARTGLPPSQLSAVSLDTLLQATPEVLGDAVMRRCARSSSSNEVVRTDLTRAEIAWAQADALNTMDHLDLAVARLGCLTEVVEPRVASRVFLLRGALLAQRGDTDAARNEFRTARFLDPAVAWRDDLPGEGRVVFEAPAPPEILASVRVLPSDNASGPWIDGVELDDELRVPEGLHLAQYSSVAGIQSAWLSVGGDTLLVLPGNFHRPVVQRMAVPEDQGAVEALLAAALPEMRAAYVAHGGGLWLITRDGHDTTTTEIDPLPPPEPEPEGRGRKKKKKEKGKTRRG